jgi:hypothetical protein
MLNLLGLDTIRRVVCYRQAAIPEGTDKGRNIDDCEKFQMEDPVLIEFRVQAYRDPQDA